MERLFDVITDEHVPRRANELADSYANYILYFHLHHR
jgi:hypothetical protein